MNGLNDYEMYCVVIETKVILLYCFKAKCTERLTFKWLSGSERWYFWLKLENNCVSHEYGPFIIGLFFCFWPGSFSRDCVNGSFPVFSNTRFEDFFLLSDLLNNSIFFNSGCKSYKGNLDTHIDISCILIISFWEYFDKLSAVKYTSMCI